MNCIKYLPKETTNLLTPDALTMYITMLSNCTQVYAPKVVSKFRVPHLIDRIFNKWEDAPEILAKLAREGFIQFADEGIVVGYTDRTVSLLAVEKTGSVDFSKVLKYADKYIKNSRIKGMAYAAKDLLVSLSSKPITTYTVKEFVLLFRACFEVWSQEPFRNFTGAEIGKMKYMLKTYEQVELANMIIEFISNSETYCSGTVPSMGLFLYHKDSLYVRVKKGSRKVYRNLDEEGFQQ